MQFNGGPTTIDRHGINSHRPFHNHIDGRDNDVDGRDIDGIDGIDGQRRNHRPDNHGRDNDANCPRWAFGNGCCFRGCGKFCGE